MSILCDRQIRRLIDEGKLIDCYTPTERERVDEQINPNSIDLTLETYYYTPNPGGVPLEYGKGTPKGYWKPGTGTLRMEPGDVVLAGTREYVRMPAGYCGQIFTKSSLGRMFINHMMAGVIDSGFEGRLTLELKNEGKHTVCLPGGARVVQLVVYKMAGVPDASYTQRAASRYSFAEGIEFSKAEK